jgi:hypothetical protein
MERIVFPAALETVAVMKALGLWREVTGMKKSRILLCIS